MAADSRSFGEVGEYRVQFHPTLEMLDDLREEKPSSGASSLETQHGADASLDSICEQMQKLDPAKLDLMSLTSSPLHEERGVAVLGWPYSLCVAHGRLYVCEGSDWSEYSLQLERRASLIKGDKHIGELFFAAEAGSGALAVAGWKGLYIVNMKGEVLQQLSELFHHDVYLGSDSRLYTVERSSSSSSSSRDQVHVYQQQRGGWVKTGQYDSPCTGGGCWFRITYMSNFIYMSCGNHNCIYKLKVDQPGEEWHNLGGAGQLRSPRVSAADQQGSVLVTDRGNNRLVVLSAGGRFTELRTEPRLEWPVSAVIAGAKLYVACAINHRIRCFKLT